MGAGIDPGMGLKPFPSSIGWISNPQPFNCESSLLITRPDFCPVYFKVMHRRILHMIVGWVLHWTLAKTYESVSGTQGIRCEGNFFSMDIWRTTKDFNLRKRKKMKSNFYFEEDSENEELWVLKLILKGDVKRYFISKRRKRNKKSLEILKWDYFAQIQTYYVFDNLEVHETWRRSREL